MFNTLRIKEQGKSIYLYLDRNFCFFFQLIAGSCCSPPIVLKYITGTGNRRMSKDKIIEKLLAENIKTGVRYHSPIPDELQQWYVYTAVSGHRILCVLKNNISGEMSETDYEEQLISAPVKTVLRGYTIDKGFVVIDALFDADEGFSTEVDDREYEAGGVIRKYGLKVGELYHPDRAEWPEAVEYNYFSGMHELRFLLKNPSRYITEVIRKMPVQLGLFLQGDIILLVYKFIDYKKQLIPVNGYSPFSIHLVPENLRTLPELPTDSEYTGELHIHLVDADTGILIAARSITLSAEFTAALCCAIVDQSRTPLTDDYNERLKEIDKTYHDNEFLMENCKQKCAG